jgi:hypothetical protein
MTTEGQVERQPMSTSDAARAIESLLDEGGDLLRAQEDEEEIAEQPAEESDDEEESPEAESDDEESNDEPEEQAPLETLDDVAEALGVSAKDLMATLKMRIKVNGEERLVSLEEAQKGHQLEADYRRKTTELSQQRQSAEQEFIQQQHLFQQRSVETAQALQLAEQALIADLNTPQMQQLRQQNPAEWVARREEAQQKLGHLQQVRQQAAMNWQQQQQYAQQNQQRQLAELLTTEQAALEEAVSRNRLTWDKEHKSRLAQYLLDQGYAPEQIGKVYDHKFVVQALKAMRVDELERKLAEIEGKTVQVKQKVAKLPQMQKPGPKTTTTNIQRKKVAELKGRMRTSGSVRDAAAVIESLL